ncbi:hypothetical protein [Nitrospira sp. BLG_2]|uniref:hypothetical protein n=1 Tax=Nitrospira sp. BLG_2 TaxID=3397507 RepID=UPI003B9BE855
MVTNAHRIPFQRLLVRFVSNSTPIERHLLAGKPLEDSERDLIYNTVLILQAALEVWQRKQGMPFSQAPRPDH